MSERGRDCGLKTLVGSVEVHSTVGSRVVQFGHQYSIFTVFGEVPSGQATILPPPDLCGQASLFPLERPLEAPSPIIEYIDLHRYQNC